LGKSCCLTRTSSTLFDENIKNHAVSLALLLIYIDFLRKVLKSIKSNSVLQLFFENKFQQNIFMIGIIIEI
jgi:hypothetical protein